MSFDHFDWIVSALSGVIGVMIVLFNDYLQRFRQAQTAKRFITEEIEVCAHMARVFGTANIMSPLYRLPTTGYNNSLSGLFSVRGLTDSQARALINFYAEVESLNRGLNQTQELRSSNSPQKELAVEFERNLMKAERLACPNGECYKAAIIAVG